MPHSNWYIYLLCRNKGKLRSSYISCTYVYLIYVAMLTVAAGRRRSIDGPLACLAALGRYIHGDTYIGASSDDAEAVVKVRAR